MVHGEALGLVKRQQRLLEELLVLLLERQGKAVDDGPQDLEQLGNAVVPVRLEDEAEAARCRGVSRVLPSLPGRATGRPPPPFTHR